MRLRDYTVSIVLASLILATLVLSLVSWTVAPLACAAFLFHRQEI